VHAAEVEDTDRDAVPPAREAVVAGVRIAVQDAEAEAAVQEQAEQLLRERRALLREPRRDPLERDAVEPGHRQNALAAELGHGRRQAHAGTARDEPPEALEAPQLGAVVELAGQRGADLAAIRLEREAALLEAAERRAQPAERGQVEAHRVGDAAVLELDRDE